MHWSSLSVNIIKLRFCISDFSRLNLGKKSSYWVWSLPPRYLVMYLGLRHTVTLNWCYNSLDGQTCHSTTRAQYGRLSNVETPRKIFRSASQEPNPTWDSAFRLLIFVEYLPISVWVPEAFERPFLDGQSSSSTRTDWQTSWGKTRWHTTFEQSNYVPFRLSSVPTARTLKFQVGNRKQVFQLW